jgi:DNA-binding beta-propeller fold protein YncE
MKTNQSIVVLNRTLPLLAIAGIIWLAAGCATAPKNSGPKYVFYPPAPNEPRLQYLTSFFSEKDLHGHGRDNFMTFLTGKPPVYMSLYKPYGIAADKGNFYVCDTVGCLMRVDLNGHRMIPINGEGPAALKQPLNLALDDNGWFYVVDSTREQVVILDTNANLVATVGQRGETEPRDVALTTNRIYIADRLNHCVHVLDKFSRTNLFDIPRPEDTTKTNIELFQPLNLALDPEGRIYVADLGAYRVQVFAPDGTYLRSIGGYGDNFGEFSRVKGIAVSRDDVLYAVDSAGQLVQMFDPTGRLLMWFGEAGASPYPLALPTKVMLDYDNVDLFQKFAAPDFKVEYLVIVINQYGPRKVSVYGFGHKK